MSRTPYSKEIMVSAYNPPQGSESSLRRVDWILSDLYVHLFLAITVVMLYNTRQSCTVTSSSYSRKVVGTGRNVGPQGPEMMFFPTSPFPNDTTKTHSLQFPVHSSQSNYRLPMDYLLERSELRLPSQSSREQHPRQLVV